MLSIANTGSHLSIDGPADSGEDDFDDHLDVLDEEMPFAWAQSDYGGPTNAVTAAGAAPFAAFAGKGLSEKNASVLSSESAQLSLRAGASFVGSDCAGMNGVVH